MKERKKLGDMSQLRMEPCLVPGFPIVFGWRVFSAGEEVEANLHYSFELGIVCAGRMLRTYPAAEFCAGPGDVWMTGIWEPHGGKVLEAPCEVVVFTVDPRIVTGQQFEEVSEMNFWAPFTADPLRRPRGGGPHAQALIEYGMRLRTMLHAIHPSPPDTRQLYCGKPSLISSDASTAISRVQMRFIFLEVMMRLCSDWSCDTATVPVSLARSSYERLHNAIERVFSAHGPISTAEAASLCAMSQAHFSRLFTRLMGVTFATFELRRRLQAVAQQLVQTDAPIKTISTEWGFVDASHLHRRFAEVYGCSPSDYRAKFSVPTTHF